MPGIGHLRLFCPVTRAAASLVLEVPGLRVLELFELRAGGKLSGFDIPRSLERAHWSWYASQHGDFEAIAQSLTLRAIGTGDAVITPAAFDALLAMPRLDWLSLESSGIDDALASRLRAGTALRSLFLAVNPLTRAGLRHIVRLESLREMDLWKTGITLDDLDLLQALPATRIPVHWRRRSRRRDPPLRPGSPAAAARATAVAAAAGARRNCFE